MKLKERIRILSYSSISASLITVILLLGGFFDILDLACASVCSLFIHVLMYEMGKKRALLIYAVSSVISILLLPMRSCSLFYVAFFGYYPVLKEYLSNKIKSKPILKTVLLLIYNIVMILLFVLFKTVFGMQNEPVYMYVLLLITSNVFYFAFDLLLSRIMIIYNYKIKKMFFGKRKK